MDIREAYHKIQKKYNLIDGVQELYLYESYLKVCKEFFLKNLYKKIAIYGSGKNTKELMLSGLQKDLLDQIRVIIDNNSCETEIEGISIIKESELKKYNIDTILISSWKYRKEMRKSIQNNYPEIVIFDPYDYVIEKLPQIEIPFFVYKGMEKYQWFSSKKRELNETKNVTSRQKLLKKLIHGYYAIYDWVDLRKTLLTYIEDNYSDKEKYLCLEKDLAIFLTSIRVEIRKRDTKDCLIFLVDSLSKYVADQMPFLSKWEKNSTKFEHYINEYPATREVLSSLLTGWHSFQDKTYLDKKIKYEDSDVLKNIEKKFIKLKLISATSSAKNYSEINDYIQGINEDLILTEILFRGIEELLKSGRQQIIIMHSYDTIHPPHWNPVSTKLTYTDTIWEEHIKRFQESVAFTDKILDFYMELLKENQQMTKIIMGDHGINLETEYAHDIANRPVSGNIGLWDMETLSPALIIWNQQFEAGTIEKFISTNSFNKILNAIIQNQDLNTVLENKHFLNLEFVPGYNENWLKRVVESQNYYLGMGMKGILSSHYIYTNFEDGTERLFQICGKQIIEINDKWGPFIEEVGENNYNLCKFPKELLKEEFFDIHNKYYERNMSMFKTCKIKNIDLEITEKCSLKCQDCFNCMQYYKKPKDISLERIKKSLDLLTENVDEISEVRILGGEPFMCKNLKEITLYVCNKTNINHVIIYTNATILLNKEELKSFQHEKISFYITNYGLKEKQKLEQYEKCLTEYHIPYEIHQLDYWYKPGNIFDNHKTEPELKLAYEFCWGRDCITLLEGKLFQCEFAANANRLGAIPDYKEDYVDLFEEENLRNRLIDFLYEKTWMKSCRWCNLTTEKVKPAIQISHSLEYEKRK